MKRLIFENQDYIIHEDESLSYIKNKHTLNVVETVLDSKTLISRYLEIIEKGEDNKFLDSMFEALIVQEIEEALDFKKKGDKNV